MSRIVCTSFSQAGYEQYGRNFLETYLRYWPLPIWVFHEGWEPEFVGPIYIDLREDADLVSFMGRFAHNPQAHGVCKNRDGKLFVNYRWQAVKFARKVYALTSPLRPDCDWWIWIDADVVTLKTVPEEFIESVCPQGFVASYLGRKDWHHSECGFVAYSKQYRGFDFLRDFRGMYDSGEIFRQQEWHDSYIFDVLRKRYEETGVFFYNISEDVPGMNVWEGTALAEYMIHLKGPVAKKGAA